GRALGAGDDLGGGEGLARAGYAEQALVGFAVLDAFHQFGNGRGLVAGGGIVGAAAEGLRLADPDRAPRAARHRGGGAADFLAAVENDLLERLHRGGDADRGGARNVFALPGLVLLHRGVEGLAHLGHGFGIGGGGAGNIAGGDPGG